ncbi:hypothetical protein [Microbispora sp. H10836]|uniref:hypothetical protein n=1 Tax=Microbispora sp. H10836 TaxID=2729106 RepID=UPI0014744180|nr:hypothetical protein [Microbispora sp. H10836]
MGDLPGAQALIACAVGRSSPAIAAAIAFLGCSIHGRKSDVEDDGNNAKRLVKQG